MQLTIICPGRVREKWLADGISEYNLRLSRYASVRIVEVADFPDSMPVQKVLAAEAELILKALSKIRGQATVVALALDGMMLDSVSFSARLVEWFEQGGSDVVFLIGGSLGLHESVLARAQFRLALSPMTFTHQMTRLILLEQCYRAFRIHSGEPYHK
ncbi:MAG: 23S rRNA (pseudouridine(1915)-N(3))-methyltransferase RlmH [Saccharofermentanales bacterium]